MGRRQFEHLDGLMRAGLALLIAASIVFGVGQHPAAAQTAEQEEAGLTSETTYESPKWGYEIEWDDPFEFYDVYAATPFKDELTLLGPDSINIQIDGIETDLTPDEYLVDSLETHIGVTGVDEAWQSLDGNQPFALTLAGGSNPKAVITQIRPLESGDGVIEVGYWMHDIEDMAGVEDALALLNDSVTLGGDPILDGVDLDAMDEIEIEVEEEAEAPDVETVEYESETWGYALEYPAIWQVETDSSEQGVDTLHLYDFNTGNYFTFYGYVGHDGDPETCLDAVSEVLPTQGYVLGDVEEEESDLLEFDASADVAARAYTYEGEYTTGPDELTETVACMSIAEGEAVLRIHVLGLARFHDNALADAQFVIDTLTLAGQEQDDDPERDDSNDPPAGDDLTETWESGQYDIVLAYNPADWEIAMEDDDPDDAYEYVQFQHPLGFISLYGDPDYSPRQLDDCMDDYLTGLESTEGVEDIEELRGESGEEDDRIWGAWSYEFTPEDGDPFIVVRYIECRSYDDITVVIVQSTLEEDFEDMAPEREALLEGLSVGDARSDDDAEADADEDDTSTGDGDSDEAGDDDADAEDSGDANAGAIAGEEARKGDIPAMFLPISELVDLGYEGYAIAYRAYTGMPTIGDYGRLAYDLETNAETIEERLADAGLTEFNILIYGLPDFESDGQADIQSNGEPLADIVSYVYFTAFEAASVEDAEAIYAVVDHTRTSHNLEELDGTVTFGDESRIVLFPDWIESDDERGRFASIDISILHGNVVFQIRLALPYDGPAPTVEQIEEIAARFMERLDAVEGGEAPGLSNLVLRMEDRYIYPAQGSYQVIDGEYQQVAGSTTSVEESLELVGNPVDFYTFRQRYIPFDPEATTYEYRVGLFVFEDEDAASAYLEERPGALRNLNPDMEERDAPALGDEAIAFQAVATDGFTESIIFVRIDNVLVRMQLYGYDAPVELVDDLAEMQMACIDSGDICEPIDVPDELVEASTAD